MLIINQDRFFYILSKCKKNTSIEGTESISLWQRLKQACDTGTGSSLLF